MRTLHGMHSRGFPNCFIMGNQQAGFTVNFPHMLNEQSKHIAYIVKHAARSRRAHASRSSEAAEQEWVDTIIRLARLGQRLPRGVHARATTTTRASRGERSGQNGFYGGGSVEFFRILQEWRAEGGLEGLELA